MTRPAHTHIKFGVVSRGATGERATGGNAVALAAYHACARFEGIDRVFDFTRKASQKALETVVLLPEGAPAWASDPAELARRMEAAERRVDSQTGRWLEMSCPLAVPPELRGEFARAVAAPLTDMGMAVQVDVHVTDALGADGRSIPGGNPHVHLLMPMRRFAGDAFSAKKAREWDAAFREERGRVMRRRLADAANAWMASQGIDARLDPGRAADRGDLTPPESDVPRRAWKAFQKAPDDADAVPHVLRQRQQRRALRDAEAEAEAAVQEAIQIRRAVARRRLADRPGIAPGDVAARRARRERTIAAMLRQHYDTGWLPASVARRLDRVTLDADTGTATLWLHDGARLIDSGDGVSLLGPQTETAVQEMAEAAARHGWTSVTVTGDSRFRDAITIALTLREPPIPVGNHVVSQAAQGRLQALLRERDGTRSRAAMAALLAEERRAEVAVSRAGTAADRRCTVGRLQAARAATAAAVAGDAATLSAAARGDLDGARRAGQVWRQATAEAERRRREALRPALPELAKGPAPRLHR